VPNVRDYARKSGAWVATAEHQCLVPGFPVEAIDTTAAGGRFTTGHLQSRSRRDSRLQRQPARFGQRRRGSGGDSTRRARIRPHPHGDRSFSPPSFSVPPPSQKNWVVLRRQENGAPRCNRSPVESESASVATCESSRRPVHTSESDGDLVTNQLLAPNIHGTGPFVRAALEESNSPMGNPWRSCKTDRGIPADGTLLFTPKKILRVRSSDGKRTTNWVATYTVDANTAGASGTSSRIPFLIATNFIYPLVLPAQIAHRKPMRWHSPCFTLNVGFRGTGRNRLYPRRTWWATLPYLPNIFCRMRSADCVEASAHVLRPSEVFRKVRTLRNPSRRSCPAMMHWYDAVS